MRIGFFYTIAAAIVLPVLAFVMFFFPCASGCEPLTPSCCCCESPEITAVICYCGPGAENLSSENGGHEFIYPPSECKFNQYAPVEISSVFNTEHIIFLDVTYYVFKPPKA
jgi:hypothetical protein